MKNLYILTGCSKGLGKALLDKLVGSEKNQVIGISRSAMESGDGFTHVELDLADSAGLIKELSSIFPPGNFKKIVLINNAGWIGEIGPLGKLDPTGIAKINAVNVVAPAILINEYVRKYYDQKCEKLVVNISSGAASKDVDGWSGYCSSKAALNRMTRVAQVESELKGYGINYYALSPGIVDTPMQADIRSADQENFSGLKKFKAFKSNNELSSPEAVAEKVLYLIDHLDEFTEVIQDVRDF
ncbi:SDR family NAD(P)-dependent oxidoreductase [Echinicola sp. CAU 1574]|uniref:SDR family NAD(P)-dependent oxidoreductase n=1 Tax=Echinicola arenosa TaxID=2774144 RepID=A0ABR9ARA4_9BACT|nr:SDR family NAD(P)-dependent oxidoreductase [Echinicola arenosa]MBD8491215.1 SDR family NAD(P)-dependent oxidoreductase [Echinicola arenosa]